MTMADDMTALSTLDMQSYAPYMENGDYYAALDTAANHLNHPLNNPMDAAADLATFMEPASFQPQQQQPQQLASVSGVVLFFFLLSF